MDGEQYLWPNLTLGVPYLLLSCFVCSLDISIQTYALPNVCADISNSCLLYIVAIIILGLLLELGNPPPVHAGLQLLQKMYCIYHLLHSHSVSCVVPCDFHPSEVRVFYYIHQSWDTYLLYHWPIVYIAEWFKLPTNRAQTERSANTQTKVGT